MDTDLSGCVWTEIHCNGTVERRVLERSCHTATHVGDHVYVIGGKRRSYFCDSVVRLNLKTHTWETVFSSLPFLKRANHSAVLIGKEIWVVGGMSSTQVYQDVHVFDTETLKWSTPKLEGNSFLLKRCAHAACVHPSTPSAFLLFGGYGGKATPAGMYSFLNDLVMISTDRKCVEQVKCTSAGELPGRAYHTFVAVGTRCFSLGGKGQNGTTGSDHFLEVFDTRSCRWVTPPKASGSAPAPRSSHKAGVVGSGILITGGVGAADADQRFHDTAVLSVMEGNGGALKLSWHSVSTAGGGPAARSAHGLVVLPHGVLLLLGYKGGNTYLSDCWMLQSGSTNDKADDKSKAASKHAVENGANKTPSPEPTSMVVKASALVVAAYTTGKAARSTPLTRGGVSRTLQKPQHEKAQDARNEALKAAGITPAGVAGAKNVSGTKEKSVSVSGLPSPTRSPGGKRGAGVSNTGGRDKDVNVSGLPSPGSKRQQATTPEWRNVKRSKAQETPKPALVTPVVTTERARIGVDATVYDLVASEETSPRQPHDQQKHAATNSNAADAVYIKKIKELEAQVSFLQSASKENRSNEAKLRTRCVALEAQVQDLTQNGERLQQLLAATNHTLEGKERQLEEVQKKLQVAEEQLASSREEVGVVHQRLSRAQQEAAAAGNEATAKIAELKKEVVDMRHQVAARTASSQQYQALADQRRKDAEGVKQQLVDLQRQLAEATKQLTITTQERQQLEGILREKEAATARLNECVDKLREESKREVIVRERKIAEQSASLEQIKAENASLISTHEKLQDSLNSLSRAMEATQKELREERRARAEASETSAREKTSLMQQLQDCESKLAASELELVRLRCQQQENKEQVDKLTAELGSVKEREALLEAQVAQTAAEVTKLRGENFHLTCQVESLRTAGSPLLDEAKSLQAVVSTLVGKLQEHHSVLQPAAGPTGGP